MPSRATRRSGPHPTQDSRRPLPTLNLRGLIMWLPPLNGLTPRPKLPEGCYDHPVVILSPQASPPTDHVVVLIVTSFDETDVSDRFRHNSKLRQAYLPIYPAQNQDTSIKLYLENGAELRKKSYVNTREQRTVPFHTLRPYRGDGTTSRHALTRDSYEKLARHARFELPESAPFKDAPTAIRPPTRTLPTPTVTQAERLCLAPVTYGTIPVSRSAPPPPPPGQDHTLTRPLIQGYYNTAQTARHYHPARSRQRDEPLLPRYYHSHSPAHHAGANSGASEWDGRTWALAKLVLGGVLFGATVWGLLSAWAHRAEIGDGLLGGVIWVGAHALRLIKGAAAGLWRAVVWLVLRLAETGKIAALKVWEWLRGGSGTHVGRAAW